MTLALLVSGLVLVLLNDDLGATKVVEHLCGHLNLRKRRGVGGDLVTINEQHCVELNDTRLVGFYTVHRDDGANLDLFLATTCAHDCVNHFLPASFMETNHRLSSENFVLIRKTDARTKVQE